MTLFVFIFLLKNRFHYHYNDVKWEVDLLGDRTQLFFLLIFFRFFFIKIIFLFLNICFISYKIYILYTLFCLLVVVIYNKYPREMTPSCMLYGVWVWFMFLDRTVLYFFW